MADSSGDLSLGYMMGQSEGGNNNGGWGGFGEGIWAVIILAILFGRGGFGWNNVGGDCGNGGGSGVAVEAAINSGFALNGITSGINGLQQGLCDGFYAVNTGMLTGFNGIQAQLADCCCSTQRALEKGFADTNYNLASQMAALNNSMCSNTRDIIDSQNAGTRAILDFLTQDKIAALTAENQTLKLAASQANQNAFITANQEAQTAELIRRLGRDCPIPAYVVPNPNCCYGNPVGVTYGNTGCNSGCC